MSGANQLLLAVMGSTLMQLLTRWPAFTVQIWSLKQETCIASLEGHTGGITCLRWCPQTGSDGVFLATYVQLLHTFQRVPLYLHLLGN